MKVGGRKSSLQEMLLTRPGDYYELRQLCRHRLPATWKGYIRGVRFLFGPRPDVTRSRPASHRMSLDWTQERLTVGPPRKGRKGPSPKD